MLFYRNEWGIHKTDLSGGIKLIGLILRKELEELSQSTLRKRQKKMLNS